MIVVHAGAVLADWTRVAWAWVITPPVLGSIAAAYAAAGVAALLLRWRRRARYNNRR